jgi:hypothetical protein
LQYGPSVSFGAASERRTLALFQKRLLGVLALFVLGAFAAIGRGQEASESKGEPGSTSAEGESASGGGSASGKEANEDTVGGTVAGEALGRFEGIVATYSVAQSEIDEEGGEQEVGEHRVGYTS